jgi:hypothetical protein
MVDTFDRSLKPDCFDATSFWRASRDSMDF